MWFHRLDVLGVPIEPSWLLTNEGRNMKVEITVSDLNGDSGLVLSNDGNEGAVFVRIQDNDNPDYQVEISIDDLKTALRKLSAK